MPLSNGIVSFDSVLACDTNGIDIAASDKIQCFQRENEYTEYLMEMVDLQDEKHGANFVCYF